MRRSEQHDLVIVGAGLAGSRCAETLRAEGFGPYYFFGPWVEHIKPA